MALPLPSSNSQKFARKFANIGAITEIRLPAGI
jgi:hypothetical protein